MSFTALTKLVKSSKATVLVAIIALVGFLFYTGKIPVETFEAILKWVVGTWMVAHAGEQVAKAIASAKTGPEVRLAPLAIDFGDHPEVAEKIAVKIKKALDGD